MGYHMTIIEDLHELDDIFGDLNMTMLHSGEKHRVFVYGTLMKGMRNHHRLTDAGAKLIATEANTYGDMKMLSRMTGGGYAAPIVITGSSFEPKGIIKGEVYEVDNKTLMRLDQFEGHPEVYERQKITVSFDQSANEVWIYIYVDVVPDSSTDLAATIAIDDDQKNGISVYQWRGE